MGYILCIAEKGDAGRKIAEVIGATNKGNGYMYGNGYFVTWARGHLVTLAEPKQYGFLSQDEIYVEENKEKALNELPLVVNKNDWKTVVIPSSKKQFDVIKELFNRDDIDMIVDCGDMGAEGHLIQWLIRKQLRCRKPVMRFCCTDLETSAIENAMNDLRDISDFSQIIKGAYCRMKEDWIIGMTFSRLFSLTYGTNLPAGRIMTPTLYLVTKRYFDVKNFVPVPFYQLETTFNEGFTAKWAKDYQNIAPDTVKDGNGRILKKSWLEERQREIESSGCGIVTVLETKKKAKNRPQLYDSAELQRDANAIYGYSVDVTEQAAQDLYNKHYVTTYPRTDCRYLTSTFVPLLEERIKWIAQYDRYAEAANAVLSKGLNIDEHTINDKEVQDHHAIVVTKEIENFDMSKLNEVERNVLHLIITRMLVHFSPKYLYNETVVNVRMANDMVFVSNDIMDVDLGYKEIEALLKEKKTEKEKKPKSGDFSKLQLNQVVHFNTVDILDCATTPPSLHTQGTLLTAMEQAGSVLDKEQKKFLAGKGIGTQATRPNTIKKLYDYKYVEPLKKGKIEYVVPTEKGITACRVFPPALLSPAISADMEKDIRAVADGTMSEDEFFEKLYAFVQKVCDDYKEKPVEAVFKSDTEYEAVSKCPLCLSDVKCYVYKDKDDKTSKGVTGFYCTKQNDENCKFRLYANNKAWVKRTKKNLTVEQMKNLSLRKKITATGINDKGVSYKFSAWLVKDEKYGVAIATDLVRKTPKK